MRRPSPELVDCPSCGVKNFAIDDVCATCHKPICIVIGPKPKLRRFGLWSLMTGIAVLAICFGTFRQSPLFGVPVALVLLPATLRSLFAIETQRAEGEHVSDSLRFSALLHGILIGLCMLPIAAIAFATVCFPIGMATLNLHDPSAMPAGLVVAITFGLAAGTWASVAVGRVYWPNVLLANPRPANRARVVRVPPASQDTPPVPPHEIEL